MRFFPAMRWVMPPGYWLEVVSVAQLRAGVKASSAVVAAAAMVVVFIFGSLVVRQA